MEFKIEYDEITCFWELYGRNNKEDEWHFYYKGEYRDCKHLKDIFSGSIFS